MRPTFGCWASGFSCTVPSIPPALPLNFCSPLTVTRKPKRFFQKALRAPGHPRTRVINMDGNPSYPKTVAELETAGNWAGAVAVARVPTRTTSWSRTTGLSNDGLTPAGGFGPSTEPAGRFRAMKRCT